MNKKYPGLIFKLYFIIFCVFIQSSHGLTAQTANNAYKLKTLIIDAGHGGKDSGSLGLRTTEKEIALAIALRTGKYIEDNFNDVKVIYTRKTDVFVPLQQRAEIANTNKADLIISIHVNALENKQVSGTMTLVLGLHRAGENFEVAKKENSVIFLEDDYNTKYEGFDPNNPESYIIFSLMQNLYFDQSINLAALVQDQFRERAQRIDRGVRQQGLLVLAQSAMPGIMIETGFISNPDEELYLMSENGQDYIASAIYRAFRGYKEVLETRTSLTASLRKRTPYSDSSAYSAPVEEDTTISVQKEIPEVPVLPSIQFKVQIIASTKRISFGDNLFKGMTGISEYKVNKMYKYAVGSSSTFQEIVPYNKQVKEKFPDAFIIAVKDNKIIPIDQALKETSGTEK